MNLRNLSPSKDTALRLLLNQGKLKKWKQATTSVGFSQRLLKIQRRHTFRKFLCRNLNAPAPGATRRLIPNTSPIEPGSIIVGLTFYVEADLKCPQFRLIQNLNAAPPPATRRLIPQKSPIESGLYYYRRPRFLDSTFVQADFETDVCLCVTLMWTRNIGLILIWSKAELLDGNRSDKTLEQLLSGTFVL